MATERAPRRGGANWPLTAGLVILVVGAGAVAYLRWPTHPGPIAALEGPRVGASSQTAPGGPDQKPQSTRSTDASSSNQQVPPQERSQAALPDRPSFDVVRVSPEGNAVIAGRAEPGSQVVVHDGERKLGEVRADRNGEFVLVPDAKLPAGGRQLTLSAREPGGAEIRSDQSVVVVVPGATAADRSASSGTGAGEAPVAVLVPGGSGASRVLQAPPAADKSQKLALNTVDYDLTGEIRFSGSARPSASVRVYVDNKLAGEANADPEGRWAVTPPGSVPAGVHRLRLDQLGPKGQVQSRIELPFQRTAAPPEGLKPGTTIVQPGSSLWRIAQARYGSGVRYTVIYLANRDQIRNPDLIYPGQVFALPASAP